MTEKKQCYRSSKYDIIKPFLDVIGSYQPNKTISNIDTRIMNLREIYITKFNETFDEVNKDYNYTRCLVEYIFFLFLDDRLKYIKSYSSYKHVVKNYQTKIKLNKECNTPKSEPKRINKNVTMCEHLLRKQQCKYCNPAICEICNVTYPKSYLKYHNKTSKHIRNVEDANNPRYTFSELIELQQGR